ncbi:MAG: hypothetical protein JW953_04170 [Anaerolineae bacterium]|nr:hypothetical protein [Anaerolineae bacterium]
MTSFKTTKTTHPALYRVYQFFVALRAGLPAWAGGGRGSLTGVDKALVASVLKTASQQRLFDHMPPNDQRHALAVVWTLSQTGHHQPALLQAALLHDVAKSLGQPLLHRALIVLLKAFWPAVLRWLAQSGSRALAAGFGPAVVKKIPRWRRPFVIHAHHPAIGAAWAKQAGCDPLAVCLIARHQDKLETAANTEEDKLLAALQKADDLN